jgi:hypothetical protein
MKYQKVFFILIAMFLFITTGCLGGIENEEQKIEVQKRNRDENNYEDFNEIIHSKDVQKVRDILDKADWENAVVNMSSSADYRFIFQFKNLEIEAKAVGYEVWISPNKDKLEIVKAENQYTQLAEENSKLLFEILTGDKLSNLK